MWPGSRCSSKSEEERNDASLILGSGTGNGDR